MKSLFPSIHKDSFFSPPAMMIGLFLLLLPFLYMLSFFYVKMENIEELTSKVDLLHKRISRKESLFKYEEKLLNQISQADPHYLEMTLESMPLLETEKQKWQIFSSHMETNKAIKERIQFLEQGKNQLRLSEGEIRKSELFQEVEEKLQTPIEMNEEDMKRLLCYLEGVRIHPFFPKDRAPQCIIKSFDLLKKTIPETKEKIFLLNLQLIKREGVSKE
jgi:hypothetical protein